MTVSERLDRLPLGRFHYRLLVLCGLGWLFDALDSGLMSFVLPSLKSEWNISATRLGLMGSAALFGMMLGGGLSGYLSDRFGRKAVFQWTLLIFTLATGLCALAWGYWSLLILRVIVGFGLGGELPVAAALISEFAPSRHRGRLIVLLESFWAVGAAARSPRDRRALRAGRAFGQRRLRCPLFPSWQVGGNLKQVPGRYRRPVSCGGGVILEVAISATVVSRLMQAVLGWRARGAVAWIGAAWVVDFPEPHHCSTSYDRCDVPDDG